ncbi:TIGR03086 family metal-binding protein [Actinopolymorpha sp. NPDC004070]|uniref:TIGR03086 family metal-binding protein n=1 Tax=Actinopolymorpha sp. NPDC004070 TaxID=3154548 RepID=UPI0033ABC80A
MNDCFHGIVDRFVSSSADFARRLRLVRPEQWSDPTPCTEWNVRLLVNHMAGGNLNYVGLVEGATSADFLRRRDQDVLGEDPVGAYDRSVRACAEAFSRPGALQRTLDYPLGEVTARQALAVRVTDSAVHTWDLARALDVDDRLDPGLVAWIEGNLDAIYAGLAETPTASRTSGRFFAAPEGVLPDGASRRSRLLHRMGRSLAG